MEILQFDLVKLLIMGVGSIVWWLLREKDAKQQKEIESVKVAYKADVDKLWLKHDEDVEKLRALEVKIASQHYVKDELDKKFDRLEVTFRQGFEALGTRFEQLTTALLDHMKDEARK